MAFIKRKTGNLMVLGDNSPLSPLPPLEHPSAFCFSPSVLNGKLRAPHTSRSSMNQQEPAVLNATPCRPSNYRCASKGSCSSFLDALDPMYGAAQRVGPKMDGVQSVSRILEMADLAHLVDIFKREEIDMLVFRTLDELDLDTIGVYGDDRDNILKLVDMFA